MKIEACPPLRVHQQAPSHYVVDKRSSSCPLAILAGIFIKCVKVSPGKTFQRRPPR